MEKYNVSKHKERSAIKHNKNVNELQEKISSKNRKMQADSPILNQQSNKHVAQQIKSICQTGMPHNHLLDTIKSLSLHTIMVNLGGGHLWHMYHVTMTAYNYGSEVSWGVVDERVYFYGKENQNFKSTKVTERLFSIECVCVLPLPLQFLSIHFTAEEDISSILVPMLSVLHPSVTLNLFDLASSFGCCG